MKAKTNKFAAIFWLLCFLLAKGVLPLQAKPAKERAEVQRHGYVFEKWVRDTFFDGYVLENYTQLWDIPKDKNKRYGQIPVQIKMTKYGSPTDLGDALRQFGIGEKFLLIIGYWKQEGDKKRVVNIVAATIEPEIYTSLWRPILWDDLQKLDAVVKNRNLTPQEARAAAKKMKSGAPFSSSVMGVHPKIDSKTQRRLQCSLSFREVFEFLAPQSDSRVLENPALFGIAAPAPFYSPPRGKGSTPFAGKTQVRRVFHDTFFNAS